MNKKVDIEDLDIPCNDIVCWDRYPKHRWVYELTRLLDSQNIKWSLFKTSDFCQEMQNILLENVCTTDLPDLGKIYVKKTEGTYLLTETYIVKGEIKYMRHVCAISDEINGDVDLLLNAFVSLHFSKFTGVITTETYRNEIYKLQLRPHSELGISTNNSVNKLLKRIYKN